MSFDNDAIDRFKGLAIVLIVVGHNHFLTDRFPFLFSFLYAFHVFLFFIIIGLRPAKELSARSVANVVMRYLVPYFVLVAATWLLYSLTIARSAPLTERAAALATGLVVGTAQTLDAATGFELFWFLPALVTTLIAWMIVSAWPTGRAVAITLAALAHAVAGLVPASLVPRIPFGILPTLYLFVFVLLAAPVAAWVRNQARLATAIGILGLIVAGFAIYTLDSRVNIGRGQVYPVTRPALLLVNDLAVVAGFVAVYGLSAVRWPTRLLETLGRASMVIFLTHQLAFQAMRIALEKSGLVRNSDSSMSTQIGLGLATIIASIAIGLVIRHVLAAIPVLGALVFPKDLASWPIARLAGRMAAYRRALVPRE